jgi:hypothetical protein
MVKLLPTRSLAGGGTTQVLVLVHTKLQATVDLPVGRREAGGRESRGRGREKEMGVGCGGGEKGRYLSKARVKRKKEKVFSWGREEERRKSRERSVGLDVLGKRAAGHHVQEVRSSS